MSVIVRTRRNVNDGQNVENENVVNFHENVTVNGRANEADNAANAGIATNSRPKRHRRPPQWYTSGDYTVNTVGTEYFV